MSKIGRQPIVLPEGVAIIHTNAHVEVKGPKGSLSRVLPREVIIEQKDSQLIVASQHSPLWGTWRAHLANMVKGVSQGFEKKLELQGIGYRVALQGNRLNFQIGFSHTVTVDIPKDLSCEVKDNIITVQGIDKEAVGQFCAYLRSLRPPDAYKGKGIRYQGEVVKLKPGKKAGVGATA